MISKNKNIQSFFDYTKKQAEILGVDIFISKRKNLTLNEEIKCAGYFCLVKKDKEYEPLLAVATGRGIKHWLPIFVHESCHMEQWMENHEFWKKSEKLDVIDEWVVGKEFHWRTINASIKNSINLEVDCEKRTVKKIIEWNLPIKIEEYIQCSNAYIMFYNYLKKTRKWSDPDKSPYRNKRIFKHMPQKWMKNYHRLPKKIEELFDKELKLIQNEKQKTIQYS